MIYIQRVLEEALKKSFSTHKILLLLGARQVGKTTLIQQAVPRHLLAGRQGGLLNMDIDIDRTRVMAAAKLTPAEAVRSLGAKEGSVLVIDEAHRVPDIGRITKGWYDAHVLIKIVLLGSSSATLLDLAAAELTGRNEKLWLTPLMFSEIVQQQEWFSNAHATTDIQRVFGDQVSALLLSRLVYGGYPEAYLSEEPEQYLTNLSSDYLLKDIFTESLVRSPEDVRRLLMELACNIGQTLSVNQLATRLSLSRQTIQRYLDLLEGIFVIFSLPAYSTDPEKEVTKSHKYYFWDNGVKNALQREWVVSSSRSDIETLWENWVIAEIMKQSKTFRRSEDLFFWQSRNGSVVDLIVKQGSVLHPFDISFNGEGKPNRAFENMYAITPRSITPQNFLELLV